MQGFLLYAEIPLSRRAFVAALTKTMLRYSTRITSRAYSLEFRHIAKAIDKDLLITKLAQYLKP